MVGMESMEIVVGVVNWRFGVRGGSYFDDESIMFDGMYYDEVGFEYGIRGLRVKESDGIVIFFFVIFGVDVEEVGFVDVVIRGIFGDGVDVLNVEVIVVVGLV